MPKKGLEKQNKELQKENDSLDEEIEVTVSSETLPVRNICTVNINVYNLGEHASYNFRFMVDLKKKKSECISCSDDKYLMLAYDKLREHINMLDKIRRMNRNRG